MLRKTKRTALVTLALAIVLAAALAPVASAHRGTVGSERDQSAAVKVSAPAQGFDVSSAAIGAAAGAGALILVLAGAAGLGRLGRGPLRPRLGH
jgi:hypothetical protein